VIKTINVIAKISFLTLFCVALAGCEYISSKMQKNPATLKQQKCWGLKNQIAFEQSSVTDSNSSTNLDRTHATELAKAMSEYNENKCDELEQKQ
jgi:uncharacterized protein YbaP (TraB family)